MTRKEAYEIATKQVDQWTTSNDDRRTVKEMITDAILQALVLDYKKWKRNITKLGEESANSSQANKG